MRIVLQEDIFLDAEKERALPAGHPDARFLLGRKGAPVSHRDAVKYGLLKEEKREVSAPDLGMEKPKKKAGKKDANKSKGPSENK